MQHCLDVVSTLGSDVGSELRNVKKPMPDFVSFSMSWTLSGRAFADSVFHEGLSFMVVGQNPTCGSTFALAAEVEGGWD